MKQTKFKLNQKVYTFEDSNKTNLIVGKINGISIIDNSKHTSSYEENEKKYLYLFMGEDNWASVDNCEKKVEEDMIYKDLRSIYKRCKKNIEKNRKLNLSILKHKVEDIKRRKKCQK